MFGLQQIYGINANVNGNSNIISNIGQHFTGSGGKLSFVERLKENVENVLNGNQHNKDNNSNTMKWSSSSSSSLNSSIDRKSVFYAEPDLVLNKITAIETADLRATLQTTEENLEMQVRKCENLISFFTNQIKRLTTELKNEKAWRARQLTKIVKALLCFEAKLKNEQKLIRRQLYEKDSEINRLAKEITVLRERYGDRTEINVNEMAQYCASCRKQYYLLENRDVGIQVLQYNPDTSPTQSADCLSSSEEGTIQSFAEARRSKKYMSKRTSGTFRDYIRSRSLVSVVDDDINGNDNDDDDDGDDDDGDGDDDDDDEDDDKENENHETCNISIKKKKELTKRSSLRSLSSFGGTTYSSLINNMHGLKLGTNSEQASPTSVISNRITDTDNGNVFNFSTSFLKKYDSEEINKSQFESNDDWYASASDMDDSDGALSKTYGQNAVNPVLECVNQILLQQSIDGIIASSPSPEASENVPKESVTIRPKRVHFSTQNSMVHVPRTDLAFLSPTPDPIKDQPFSYESVYTNEYEPIGSENNSSSHYVDMEAKVGHDDRQTNITPPKAKIPPALPPKPANLLKLKQALKMSSMKFSNALSKQLPTPNESIDRISEPDYCSISEVNEVMKKIKIVADVHKNADEMSTTSEDAKTDMTDETFADVPKLPNVAAIISPKKEVVNKFIAQDNYITKSPVKAIEENTVPFVLAEINYKKSTPSPIKMTKITQQMNGPKSAPISRVNDDKMSIHAEFDWYNLDVEYGKLNPPDVVKEININQNEYPNEIIERVDEIDEDNVGVEYNLEQEFVLNGSPDIIQKVSHDSVDSTSMKQTLQFHETPIQKKTFESFLDDTGLITKPLPRKRKVYYTAPFV